MHNQISEKKIRYLNKLVGEKVDDLVDALGVKLRRSERMYYGRCPIHCGNNNSAFNLYRDGVSVKGNWRCNTHRCESKFVGTAIGFTRGVLSCQNGWTEIVPTNNIYPYNKTIDWLCNFIGKSLDQIEVDASSFDKENFVNSVSCYSKKPRNEEGYSREAVRKNLVVPAEYYLERGYSYNLLDAYDIGLCRKPGSMNNRVVVPVFNDDGKRVIGCCGRSIFEECNSCHHYHDSKLSCLTVDDCSKWRNTKGFNRNSYLYNYWNAKNYIKKTGKAILVEGPGDVLRLIDAGIFNVVGLFGCSLSDEQQITLELSSAMKLIVLLDNDQAGEHGRDMIRKTCSRSYQLEFPSFSGHDIGGLSTQQIKEELTCLRN
jgi:5S rRNA maturation endonuclease (ribonuclease M5)